MFAKKFHLICFRAVAIVLACITTLFFSLSVAMASSGGHFDPLPAYEEAPQNEQIPLSTDAAPVPPIGRAYMGAPLILFDGDQDTTLLPTEERWIDVDLSEQTLIAFEGTRPVRHFVISSGLPGTPTVTGTFRVRAKVRTQTMSGDGYSLPNVEWVQYFYEDYALHGSYWHNNFGNPMSRGCINMTNEDAKWLFEWAGPEWNGDIWMHVPDGEGTLVVVHE